MNRDDYKGLQKISWDNHPKIGDIFMTFALGDGEECARVLILENPEADHYYKTSPLLWRFKGLVLYDWADDDLVGEIHTYAYDSTKDHQYFLPAYP